MALAIFSYLEALLVTKIKGLWLMGISLNSTAAKVLSQSLQSQHCSLVILVLSDGHFQIDVLTQL